LLKLFHYIISIIKLLDKTAYSNIQQRSDQESECVFKSNSKTECDSAESFSKSLYEQYQNRDW